MRPLTPPDPEPSPPSAAGAANPSPSPPSLVPARESAREDDTDEATEPRTDAGAGTNRRADESGTEPASPLTPADHTANTDADNTAERGGGGGGGDGGGLIIRPGSNGAALPSRMWVHYVGDPEEREEEQLDPFAICVREIDVFLRAAKAAQRSSAADDDDERERPPTTACDEGDALIAGEHALEASMRLPQRLAPTRSSSSAGSSSSSSGDNPAFSHPTELCAQSPRPEEDVGPGAEEGRSKEGGEMERKGATLIVDGTCLPDEPGRKARETQAQEEPDPPPFARRPSLRRAHSSPLPTAVPSPSLTLPSSSPSKPTRSSSAALVPTSPRRPSPASPGSCGSPRGVVSAEADWREPRGRGSYFPANVS